MIGILRRAARRTSLWQRWIRMDKEIGVALKDTRGRVVGEEILKDFCGSLLILGKLPKVFGATDLGKGCNGLDANEGFFITYTLQECGAEGVVNILADEIGDEKRDERGRTRTRVRRDARLPPQRSIQRGSARFCLLPGSL